LWQATAEAASTTAQIRLNAISMPLEYECKSPPGCSRGSSSVSQIVFLYGVRGLELKLGQWLHNISRRFIEFYSVACNKTNALVSQTGAASTRFHTLRVARLSYCLHTARLLAFRYAENSSNSTAPPGRAPRRPCSSSSPSCAIVC